MMKQVSCGDYQGWGVGKDILQICLKSLENLFFIDDFDVVISENIRDGVVIGVVFCDY